MVHKDRAKELSYNIVYNTNKIIRYQRLLPWNGLLQNMMYQFIFVSVCVYTNVPPFGCNACPRGLVYLSTLVSGVYDGGAI